MKLPEAGTKVERTILKPEQVLAIVNELEEPYATFVLFLAITGLRVGEAVGVRWSDMEGTALHVHRRIYEGKAGEVKTKKSRRTLPLPEELIDRMKALPSGDYIFRTRAGSPMNPKNAAHRHLRPALRKLGIHLGGWHDFRHTFTTILLKGVSAESRFNGSGTRKHEDHNRCLPAHRLRRPEGPVSWNER